MRAGLAALAAFTLGALAATSADAKPAPRVRKAVAKPSPKPAVARPRAEAAHARVAVSRLGELRPAREAVGRRDEPLSAEEDTAKQIQKLLRGPLRNGVTGLFVADARTGNPLFAVNAENPLNPASNVKMISTAAALELLGADFTYPTRLLATPPSGGVVYGDAYLLGSYDPTLSIRDLDDIAAAVAARGITRIDGSLVVGSDPMRDGVYRSVIPVEIHGGEPGAPAVATTPSGMDLVSVRVTATTSKSRRSRLTYRVETASDDTGRPRVIFTVGGTIARGSTTTYPLITRERTATAAYALRAALSAHGVSLRGDFKTGEFADFVGNAIHAGSLPVELGRHDSARLAAIVAHVNKWSVNWLADRVIMTAAALARQQPPSMELALDAMYSWLDRHPKIAKHDLLVDTGSGLSYRTRITPHELVSIVRSAAGFTPDADTALSRAWLDSLAIAGTDGTLSSRFRTSELRGRIRGKTGTLSSVIALSGILDLDPQRPLAFSLVTNGTTRLSPRYVRRVHEQLVGLLYRYLARTQRGATPALTAPVAPSPDAPLEPDAGEETVLPEFDGLRGLELDDAPDGEAAVQR